jgi:hypothetical protein
VQLNPYTPGQLPRVLAGRTRELGRLRDRLGRVSTFGEFAGPLLTFQGPRGLGKTSLLREAESDAQAAGFVSVWVSTTHETSLLEELDAAVDHALGRTDALSEADVSRWRTASRTLGAELSAHLGPVSGKVTRSTTSEPPPRPRAPIHALIETLGTAARLVTDAGGAGLVVFLDELHAASTEDLAILLNALQMLDGERDQHRMAVFAAGLPSTAGLLTKAATFGERTFFVELHRLDAAAATDALVAPAAELEVSWARDALEAVLRSAGGFPYFLQLLGDSAWNAARPEPGAVITLEDAIAGRHEALEQLGAMYRARWEAATEKERDFMVAMSAQPEPAGRKMIAAALNMPSRSLSGVRDRLVEKGIIESAQHGTVRFTLPGFSNYVRAQVDASADFAELMFAPPDELHGP